MKLLIEDKRTYIPYFNGNRNLPEEDQVVVTYRVPDITLKRRLKPGPKFKFNYDQQGNTQGGEVEISTDTMSVVSGMLISIKHLSYEDSKGEHQITNAKELYAGPLEYEPLVDELYKEFSKELDRVVDEKN
jgi:hypothetical protein